MREPGFYWVKWWGRWEVGEFTVFKCWMLAGLGRNTGDAELDAIGPKVEKPEGLE